MGGKGEKKKSLENVPFKAAGLSFGKPGRGKNADDGDWKTDGGKTRLEPGEEF